MYVDSVINKHKVAFWNKFLRAHKKKKRDRSKTRLIIIYLLNSSRVNALSLHVRLYTFFSYLAVAIEGLLMELEKNLKFV